MAKKITYESDIGNIQTNTLLKSLENKIQKEYSKASKEVEEKLEDYLERYEKKNKTRLKYLNKQMTRYKAGEISWNEYKLAKNEYTQWRIGQIAIGERWEKMRDTLAQDLTNASEICRGMTEGYMVDAYALNFNYGTYLCETQSLASTSFTLYDHATVQRLISSNPNLLPMMSSKTEAKIRAGLLQVWNGQKITSAITQGIIQGESIGKIAKRLRGVADMDYKASIRNARTSITSAQNGGRLDSYKRVQSMGIEMEKQWLATFDSRTRHEHRLLDGQIKPIDEPFEVEGYELMFPADPSGEAFLVYNCRCTMVSKFKGYSKSIKDYRIDKLLDGMTYEEWQQSDGVSKPIDSQEKKGRAIKQSYINDYRRMSK